MRGRRLLRSWYRFRLRPRDRIALVPELWGQCALVVPCYNEAKRLNVPAYAAFLRSCPPGFRLIFVDDGSSDETLRVLDSLRADFGDAAVVLPKRPNGGKAEAVRFGMNYAVSELGASVTGFWDADLATPLDAVADLLGVLEADERVHMVFGARVKLLGRRIERRVARHYLGRVFATVVSNVLELPVYDTQCGAKLFRVSADFREVLRDSFLSRGIFDVEIIARFIQRRGVAWVQESIYEFPLYRWEDVAGSKVKSGDFLKAAGEILVIWNKYLRRGSGK